MRPEKLTLAGSIPFVVFFLVIVVVGLIVSNRYYLQLFTFIGINTLLTLGLNMLMGYAGQISLGHAAFLWPRRLRQRHTERALAVLALAGAAPGAASGGDRGFRCRCARP